MFNILQQHLYYTDKHNKMQKEQLNVTNSELE